MGARTHHVKQGECVDSIAFRAGHIWETIWLHPDNAELREARVDPNCLLYGDCLVIPPLREREENCPTEERTRFRRRGVPDTLRLRLLDVQGEPRAGVAYRGEIDGRPFAGEADGEGVIILSIPPDAREGYVITVEDGDDGETYELQLGGLDPVTEVRGVQARLRNLGFDCGEIDGVYGRRTQVAVSRFQRSCDLEATGEMDSATRDQLREAHGC